MRVAYKPQRRYTCTALAASYGAATCLHIDGASLEQVVIEAFFAALAPAELDLLDEVLATQRADQARLAHYYADQVARAEYAARLAQRQYQAVDPDHRLVASELERQWEVALQGVADARAAADQYAPPPPPPQLAPPMRAQLPALGPSPPPPWAPGPLPPAPPKKLLPGLVRHGPAAPPG